MSNKNSEHLDGPRSTRTDFIHVQALLDRLEARLSYRVYQPGYRFIYSFDNQDYCLFLRSGIINMYRQPNDILIEFIDAPSMRGIIPIHPGSKSVFTLKVVTPAEIAILERNEFYALLTELNLWETFSHHLQSICSATIEAMLKLTSPSVFDIVRNQLYELMEKPTEVRENITIESYVRGKTRVSRSSVMKVLADLKTGGYITVENGILKGINKIPRRY